MTLLVSAVLLSLALPAIAAPNRVTATAQNGRDRTWTDARLLRLLDTLGYQRQVNESNIFYFKNKQGDRIRLTRYENGDFLLYFSQPETLPFRVVNRWNGQSTLTRAYLGHTGDTVLESDLAGGAPISEAQMRLFLTNFENRLQAWKDYIQRSNQTDTTNNTDTPVIDTPSSPTTPVQP